MITPTIGRRMWYWPTDFDKNGGDMQIGDDTQPLDAGVALVINDHLVNISVSDQLGRMFYRTSVRIRQPEEARPEGGGFVEWMPYQLKTAGA